MPRLSVPAMIDAAHKYGLTVEVVPGAEFRGSSSFNPKVFVGHHTAGAKTGVRPSLNLCVHGRPDLDGPLCNWFLDRNGVAVIVAAGRANHAGAGGFRGVVGNSGAQGCEAESVGDGNDWTAAQLDAYPRVVAAGLTVMGQGADWYCAHRTWAPTRKIDPKGIDDDWMRTRVRQLMAAPPAAAKTTGEWNMSKLDPELEKQLRGLVAAETRTVLMAILPYFLGAMTGGNSMFPKGNPELAELLRDAADNDDNVRAQLQPVLAEMDAVTKQLRALSAVTEQLAQQPADTAPPAKST